MTRVLYVEGNEDGTVGGSHKIQADLVTRLSPRYTPVVLYYQDNRWGDRLRELGLEVHAWDEVRKDELAGLRTGNKLRTLWALVRAIARRYRFIRDHRIDLIHLNNSPLYCHDDWLPAARLAGVPCTVYAMGEMPRERSAIRRFLMRRFDTVFPLSRFVEEGLRANGIPPDRILLTHPGVDLEEVDTRTYRPRDDVRAEFGLREDRLLAVMVGNVREWKGQHRVVEALRLLSPRERARLLVLLVGEARSEDTPYRRRIESMIAEADLGDCVVLAGWRGDVPDLLEAADICLHASVAPEPFGLVVQEGMLHGCAPIAANAGGPVEMLTPESGLMFDADRPEELAAHLRLLIEDPGRRLELARNARVRARRFDVRTHVGMVESAYERLSS